MGLRIDATADIEESIAKAILNTYGKEVKVKKVR